MKVIKFPKLLSRKYLRLASVYRRFAERSNHYDFSMEMLLECFHYESSGCGVSKMNGYVHGKRQKDITLVMWKQDILNGQACKAEYIQGINSWWAKKALTHLIIRSPFFPFGK